MGKNKPSLCHKIYNLVLISTKKQDLALVSALEELVETGAVKLVVTDLVAE